MGPGTDTKEAERKARKIEAYYRAGLDLADAIIVTEQYWDTKNK